MTADLTTTQHADLPDSLAPHDYDPLYNRFCGVCHGDADIAAHFIQPQQITGRMAGVYLIGHIEDLDGARMTVGTDLSEVTISANGARLDPAGRHRLAWLLSESGRVADNWAAQDADTDA